ELSHTYFVASTVMSRNTASTSHGAGPTGTRTRNRVFFVMMSFLPRVRRAVRSPTPTGSCSRRFSRRRREFHHKDKDSERCGSPSSRDRFRSAEHHRQSLLRNQI